MGLDVFLLVLAAAAMHAGWNAVVKGGADPFVSVTHVSLFSGLTALCLLPLVSIPVAAAWPWLILSAALHTVYRFMLIGAYRTGDMAQVYPIMRGAAPMMTAIGTALLIGEVISVTGFLAVGALSCGVFLMSLKGGRVGAFQGRAVAFALASATATCGYSLADGYGARLNGSGPSYAMWMFVGNAVTMQSIALAMRGRAVYADLPKTWALSAGGGIMSMTAYFIVIWAMTKAPIALVAALRETSVLFGAVIALVILREPLTGWRVLASLLVVVGVVLLRVA
jgi:drug/metabolite transporter (DMT)-like permease